MGTRYSKGDIVKHKNNRKLHKVKKIENPNSDSPNYIIKKLGYNKTKKVNASQIKKANNGHPYLNKTT